MVNQNKQSMGRRATIVAVFTLATMTLTAIAVPASQVSAAESVPWTELTPATPRADVQVTPGSVGFSVTFAESVTPETATNLANYYYKYPCLGTSYIDLCNPIETTLAGADAIASYDPQTNTATISWPAASTLAIGFEQQWGVRNIATVALGDMIAGSSFSSPLQAPTVPGAPVATNPSHVRTLNWSWAASLDTDGSNVAGYEYTLQRDGVTVSEGYTLDSVLSLTVDADGAYVLSISAVDRAGNRSDVASGSTTVVTTGPVVSVSGGGATGNATVQPIVAVESAGTVSYSWVAQTAGVAISDISARAPLFSVTADGTYTLALIVTDEWGNFTTAYFTFTYAEPFVPTDDTGVTPIDTTPIPPVTPPVVILATQRSSSYRVNDAVAAPATSPANSNQSPVTPVATDQDTMVDGASTLPSSNQISGAIVPTPQGWRIFGLLWYWWALIIAFIVTVWRSIVLTKSNDE